MPLLVAQRNSTHVVASLDHSKTITEQPLDFTMSKYKTSSRHPLYRQFYRAEDSPPYDKHEEQGKYIIFNKFYFIYKYSPRGQFIIFWGNLK